MNRAGPQLRRIVARLMGRDRQSVSGESRTGCSNRPPKLQAPGARTDNHEACQPDDALQQRTRRGNLFGQPDPSGRARTPATEARTPFSGETGCCSSTSIDGGPTCFEYSPHASPTSATTAIASFLSRFRTNLLTNNQETTMTIELIEKKSRS